MLRSRGSAGRRWLWPTNYHFPGNSRATSSLVSSERQRRNPTNANSSKASLAIYCSTNRQLLTINKNAIVIIDVYLMVSTDLDVVNICFRHNPSQETLCLPKMRELLIRFQLVCHHALFKCQSLFTESHKLKNHKILREIIKLLYNVILYIII